MAREKVTFGYFKGEEFKSLLAGSRFERERLLESLKDAEAGSFPRFLLDAVPLAPLETNSSSLAMQRLEGRLRDVLNIAVDLENRLVVSQQKLDGAQNQTSTSADVLTLGVRK